MELSNALSLSAITKANDISQTQCIVFLNGINTGIRVSGQILEASFKVSASRYLLILSDDVIFEESLNITLIDVEYGVLENLTLGGPYTSGVFEDLLINSHSIKFRFIGDTVWTIEPLSSPSLRIPFRDPRGVTRRFGIKKYLNVSATPSPARADGSR